MRGGVDEEWSGFWLKSEFRFTIVCIEHVMRIIMSLSDRIVALDHGRVLAAGTPAEVAANEAGQVTSIYRAVNAKELQGEFLYHSGFTHSLTLIENDSPRRAGARRPIGAAGGRGQG